MNRPWPIGILAFFFIYLAANASSTVIWAIAIVAMLALAALIFIMYQKDQFVGPSTLMDDVRSIGDRFVSDDGDDDILLLNQNEEVDIEVHRKRS